MHSEPFLLDLEELDLMMLLFFLSINFACLYLPDPDCESAAVFNSAEPTTNLVRCSHCLFRLGTLEVGGIPHRNCPWM